MPEGTETGRKKLKSPWVAEVGLERCFHAMKCRITPAKKLHGYPMFVNLLRPPHLLCLVATAGQRQGRIPWRFGSQTRTSPTMLRHSDTLNPRLPRHLTLVQAATAAVSPADAGSGTLDSALALCLMPRTCSLAFLYSASTFFYCPRIARIPFVETSIKGR